MALDLAFRGKYLIRGSIWCVTGLHIGGTTEGFEIGGVDNAVIRDPLTGYPYIPGSSLKGKLRHLLEWSLGKIEKHPKQSGYTAHFCGECDACVLFGAASDDNAVRMKSGPTRLTVRDAFPTDDTLQEWTKWLGEKVYTEIKTENALDRVTSEANPRPIERVPAGSEFTFDMVFDAYRPNDASGLMRSLFGAMHLLEHSALGGSGSRGHGKIEFRKLSIEARPVEFYTHGTDGVTVQLPGATIKGLVEGFDQIAWSF